MNSVIKSLNDEWQRKAIEKTMADPNFPKDMCPICVMNHPCLCDDDVERAVIHNLTANPYQRDGRWYFYDETADEHGPYEVGGQSA